MLISVGIMALYSSKTYSVISNKCIGCGICESVCPNNAITIVNKKAVIDLDKCNNCGECVAVCPTQAISLLDKKDAKTSQIIDEEKISLEKDAPKNKATLNKKTEVKKKTTLKEIEPKKQKSILKKVVQTAKKVYSVESSKCIGCKICFSKCPVNAIEMVNGKAVIDVNKCIQCGICENVCPTKAISHSQKTDSKLKDNSKDKNIKPAKNTSQEKNSLEKDVPKNKATLNKKTEIKKKTTLKKIEPKKQITKKTTLKEVEPKKQESILKKVVQVAKKVYSVESSKCIGCKICVSKCPVNAIEMVNGKAVIDVDKCIQCGICENVCPTKAISHSQKTDSKLKDNSKDKNIKPAKNTSQEKNSLEKDVPKNKATLNKKAENINTLTKNIQKKINYLIYKFKCVGCEDCVEICPVNAITMVNGKAVIDQTKCISCGKCVDACTYSAIEGK